MFAYLDYTKHARSIYASMANDALDERIIKILDRIGSSRSDHQNTNDDVADTIRKY